LEEIKCNTRTWTVKLTLTQHYSLPTYASTLMNGTLISITVITLMNEFNKQTNIDIIRMIKLWKGCKLCFFFPSQVYIIGIITKYDFKVFWVGRMTLLVNVMMMKVFKMCLLVDCSVGIVQKNLSFEKTSHK
jgi:hypothetical protein